MKVILPRVYVVLESAEGQPPAFPGNSIFPVQETLPSTASLPSRQLSMSVVLLKGPPWRGGGQQPVLHSACLSQGSRTGTHILSFWVGEKTTGLTVEGMGSVSWPENMNHQISAQPKAKRIQYLASHGGPPPALLSTSAATVLWACWVIAGGTAEREA